MKIYCNLTITWLLQKTRAFKKGSQKIKFRLQIQEK